MLSDSLHTCDGGRVWAPALTLVTIVQITKILYQNVNWPPSNPVKLVLQWTAANVENPTIYYNP
jgi:hypothetical protein